MVKGTSLLICNHSVGCKPVTPQDYIVIFCVILNLCFNLSFSEELQDIIKEKTEV